MSSLVTDRQPCPANEKQDLIRYLKTHSHVQDPVALMGQGWLLEKGSVKGIAAIGQLRTCFRNLGLAYCQVLYGADYFLVGQALETLTNPNYRHHPDIADGMKKIHEYKYKFARTDSDPKVTIIEWNGEPILADGDKTAIAAYLYALETSKGDFILPVYYVSPPQVSPVQPTKSGS
jgi:hypothetical protein